MNSRERVRTALNHQEPDKVPIDLGGFVTTIEAEAYDDLKKYLGIEKDTMVFLRSHVAPDEEILQRFEVDTRYVRVRPTERWEEVRKTDTVVDSWGTKWHQPKSSHYFDPIEHPFANFTLADLENYQYPQLWNEEYANKLAKIAETLYKETDYYLIGDCYFLGIFEQAWVLRGLENFLVDLVLNKDFANKVLDIVLEERKDFYGRFLDVVGPYVDMVIVSDDLGTQEGPIISPKLYREMIKPRHKELNSFIKGKADVKLLHHSCGAVREFIEDFIDVGIDVLNPVQVSAKGMDTEKLKQDFGDRIVFWGGGVDTQDVLPFGSPKEVREEVKKRISDLKPGGGFVFAQVHEIQPNTPPENIIAMFDTVKEYRDYQSKDR